MTSETWQTFEDVMTRLHVVGSVAVGVSGGADSMALLHLLCAWNKSAGNQLDLTALTVDHGLRAESATEAAAVGAWARDLGIKHRTLIWDDEKPSSNIEAVAREARYRLIGEWCVENRVQTFMTAHHFDDQAETFLMRLVRGSGVAGLSAIAEERSLGGGFASIRLLRPLLKIPKIDLTALLQDVQQPWVEDPSNEDGEFTRARLRNMRETFENLGLTSERIVATANRMSEANMVLQRAADLLWQQAASVSPFGEVVLDRKALMDGEADTRRRVLAHALKAVSGTNFGPRYERLLRLEKAITADQTGSGVTLHGCKITDKGGALSIIREAGRIEAQAISPGSMELWDGRFHIQWAARDERETEDNWEIRAIGGPGLKSLRDQGWAMPEALPHRDILLTLPAAWQGDKVICVPLLGFGPALFKARFMLFA